MWMVRMRSVQSLVCRHHMSPNKKFSYPNKNREIEQHSNRLKGKEARWRIRSLVKS